MRILLINHYAGSPKLGMEYRPYYFAKYWQKKGHKVTIISASNSHLRTSQPQILKNIQEEEIDGIKYIWVKTPRYIGNGLGRISNMIIFIIKLYFKASFFSKLVSPNVVIASSTYPLDFLPAKRISDITKAKLIFEVHDLWPLSPLELGGYSNYHPFIIVLQWAENFAYKNCDCLVTMLPKTLEYMVLHGLRPDKFHYIPNGIDIKEWKNNKPIPEEYEILIQGLKAKGNSLIAYTGAHGIANDLDSLIEAANLMKNLKVSFLLVGSGSEKERLEKKASFYKLTNLFFLKSIPKNSIPTFLEKMDILYIGLKKQSLFRFGISPNKLIDYLMAGRPIIQAIEAGNDIVSEAMCGISIESENPVKIKESILKLINLPSHDKSILGKNGKNYALKNHEYGSLSDKFLKIIED